MRVALPVSVCLCLALSLGVSSCRQAKGDSPKEKRAYVMKMRDDALAELYRVRPGAKEHVEGAPGYAVFSNIASKILFLATGNGFGVVVDNGSGKETFMKMIEGGGGIGLGVKTYRAVYVFNSKDALETFVTSGWQAGGDADAAAKYGDKGGEASAALTSDELTKPVTVYQFTDSGVALSAVATGTKYYPDEELN